MKLRLCRGCFAPLVETFIDLGMSPLSNAYLRPDELDSPETFYPLHARVCSQCFLVQLDAFESPERIFADYAYFSSYSSSWLAHAQEYVDDAVSRWNLGSSSFVVEVASNDGYLLQYVGHRGVPYCGIEPARNVADIANGLGIRTESFFLGVGSGRAFAARRGQADLVIANNVLAHVPDLHDFVGGIAALLKPTGVASFEFPHLLELITRIEFDTIYHEHFSYFSLLALEPVFESHGLHVFDAEQIETHGGSLRLWLAPISAGRETTKGVQALRGLERNCALDRIETYQRFAPAVLACRRDLVGFLIEASRAGKRVVGYGAAAKGNTFLNYCGIKADMLPFVADLNPAKIGHYLPGTHIPVVHARDVEESAADYVLILPWNIRDEIMEQLSSMRRWGTQFVTAIPRLEILP